MTRFAIDPVTFVLVARSARQVGAGHQLVAPNSLRTRSLEFLLSEVLSGQLDDRAALQIHERITALKVRLLGDRVSRRVAWDLARQNGWDDLAHSEYIAVARLQADALVTINKGLAAKADGLVPLAPVEDLFRHI